MTPPATPPETSPATHPSTPPATSPATPPANPPATPSDHLMELNVILFAILVTDFLNTLLRETAKLRVKDANTSATAIFVVLGAIYLGSVSTIAIVWHCKERSCLQNRVREICIGLQILAGVLYFLGDNADDIIEHAKKWMDENKEEKCIGTCQTILKILAWITLMVALVLFQNIVPLLHVKFCSTSQSSAEDTRINKMTK